MKNREIRLASRPKGVPTADNFTLATTELKPLRDQEVLVRNLRLARFRERLPKVSAAIATNPESVEYQALKTSMEPLQGSDSYFHPTQGWMIQSLWD